MSKETFDRVKKLLDMSNDHFAEYLRWKMELYEAATKGALSAKHLDVPEESEDGEEDRTDKRDARSR